MRVAAAKLCVAALLAFALSAPAQAASYTSLKKQGYKTGPLTKNAAGRRGWKLHGRNRYFCAMRVGLARNGNKAIGFTTSGRIIPMGRATRKGLPDLADLKAGRPRSRDVGSCRKLK